MATCLFDEMAMKTSRRSSRSGQGATDACQRSSQRISHPLAATAVIGFRRAAGYILGSTKSQRSELSRIPVLSRLRSGADPCTPQNSQENRQPGLAFPRHPPYPHLRIPYYCNLRVRRDRPRHRKKRGASIGADDVLGNRARRRRAISPTGLLRFIVDSITVAMARR